MIRNILKSEIIRNTFTLMMGTVFSQAIPIATIPILTRIFTPEDFGLLALYGACVTILGVIIAGRYEITIMLPKSDEEAKTLLQISIIISFLIATLLFIPILFLNEEIVNFLANENIAPWLYLLPVSALLTGIYQSLTYWNNRQKNFKVIAVSRVNQSLTQGLIQTSLGFLKISGGLIIGQTIGIASSVILLTKKDKTHKRIKDIKNKNAIIRKMLEYRKFPQYSILGSLCDTAAAQMPIFILTRFYSQTITGVFSLTFRVLNIPAIVISAAVGQVFFQKIVEINHTAPEKLNKYIIKTFIILLLTYLPAIPILFIWGDDLFAFVFGEKWREAGVYAGYLVIAVAIRFAVSPLSTVMGLEKNVKTGVFWQVLYFCTIIPTLYLSSSLPIKQFFIIFTIHELILYFIYLTLIIKSSKTKT